MRFLFVSNVISGYLAPILEFIAARPENELIVASERVRKGSEIRGARRVKLKHPDVREKPESIFAYWQMAANTGKLAQQSLETIAESGFMPDIVMACTINGATLGLRDAFPGAFRISYLESRNEKSLAASRFKRQMQILQTFESDLVFAFGKMDKRLSSLARPAPLAVYAKYFSCAKNGLENDAAIFFLKNLDEGDFNRWFIKALSYCKNRQKKTVLWLPDMEVLRACLKIIEKDEQLSKCLECVCNPLDSQAREIFCKAELFVWPGKEIIPEVLQAMSCGLIVAASKVGDILVHGFNCIPLENYDKPEIISKVAGLRARQTVLEKFAADKIVPEHLNEIMEAMAQKRQK